VFSKPDVQKWFQPYLMTQLYTDIVPLEFYGGGANTDVDRRKADAEQVNVKFQGDVFNDLQRPLYPIIEPQAEGRIDIVGVYAEGRIIDEKGFVEFLKNPKK
jgi:hypothetical protein